MRVTRVTQVEQLKQWLGIKMEGDGTNNKQQAMCSTHRDIWWPVRAHQQNGDMFLFKTYVMAFSAVSTQKHPFQHTYQQEAQLY